MKKIVYSILAIITVFLLNIGLYFYSENYSFFLKKIKYGDSVIEQNSLNITDDYLPENNKKSCNCDDVKMLNCEKINSGILNIEESNIVKESKVIDFTGQLNELFSYFDKNTLSKKNYDEYYKIFDITDEYPTEYLTFINENYELYLFTSGKFDDIYNMFELLSNDKSSQIKFSLNKLNNFSKKSFFINMLVDDGKIRLVIDNGKILFGLNIKKSYYNNIKTILEKF